MHKIALISDVHSCYMGLEMVLKDAAKRGVDEFICCGDYVSDGPEGEEVVQRVRQLNGHIIRGNREDYMLAYQDGLLKGWDDSLQCAPLLWTYNRLSKSSLHYMRTLPDKKSIRILGHEILVCHGSPYSSTELIEPLSTARFRQICADHHESVFVFGHTHFLWGIRFQDRYFVNAGCAGMPDIGSFPNSNVAYGVMTITKANISFERVMLPYDFGVFETYFNTSNYVQDNGIWPELILTSLKTGHNYCKAFLDYCHEVAGQEGVSGYKLIPNEIWEKAVATWTYRPVL